MLPRSRLTIYLHFLGLALIVASQPAAASQCGAEGVALQVLGSGGPRPDSDRASSGYLLWMDGKARALIEAGGGTFVRFGEAGARLKDLDLIALTHFHTDHSADLPAILKEAIFSERQRALPVSGPSGGGPFPPVGVFLDRMFAKDQGAFAYLSGLLSGSQGLFKLKPIEVDAHAQQPVEVFANERFKVEAVSVHHGPVPALGYLLTVGDTRIAISGDQNFKTDYFTRMIHGADIFVMPTAVPQMDKPVPLHARPAEIGKAAQQAGVELLVLSHWMPRSLENRDKNIEIVKKQYEGPVVAATDLMCIENG